VHTVPIELVDPTHKVMAGETAMITVLEPGR
jgi:hypothetical protein